MRAMPISPRNMQEPPSPVDQAMIGDAVARLDTAADFAAAEAALRSIAEAIGMPVLAWSPDVSRPDLDPQMDAFFRRGGWTDEVLALWWDRTVMLKSPLYIRCRTGSMPFVTVPSDKLPARPAELRKISAAIHAMGVRSLITTPIHLPRGLVSMITWGGPLSKAQARSVLAQTRPALLTAGYLFMHAYQASAAAISSSEEELTRLTPREWECLRFTAQGHREEQVATMLGLGATTVRYHLDNVVRKLGAANRVHAVALAAQLGLIGPIG
jgi:DNA-binding CsgD family transcriptional regulator